MLSIRYLARSVPRIASTVTKSAICSSFRPNVLAQAACSPLRSQAAAAFSTSAIRSEKAGQVDEELVEKFQSEISLEEEMRDGMEVPTSVKEYLDNGPFEIVDTPGNEEVLLTRNYGDEKISVTFSIADLNAIDPENDFVDPAMADEDDANINQGSKSEDSVSAAENEDGEIDDQAESFPVRVNITIEKAGKGALAIETVAQDGQIVIDSVYYYTDASMADAKTAEIAHARQEKYVGPPFGNLDEDLQVLLERYLDERGINTALALFVPDYIDMKEQKEYMSWLSNVKSFVEA